MIETAADVGERERTAANHRSRSALALWCMTMVVLMGCNGTANRATPRPRQVVASDFLSPENSTEPQLASDQSQAHSKPAPSASSEQDSSGEPDTPSLADTIEARSSTARAEIDDATIDHHKAAASPAPAADSLLPLLPGETYVIDRLIGQINGRPIFADEFFAPIEDRLMAARQSMIPADFVNELEAVVDARLQEVALNELFISEAQAALTPEEQMGMSRWQRAVRELLLARNSGIEGQAEQRLEEEGISLDQRLMAIKDEALVRRLIERKITPRVIVSWRDIEREFRRRAEEFNPPGEVRLTRIVIPTEDNQQLISEISDRLRSESFQSVADSLAPTLVSPWGPFTMRDGKIADLPLVDETLKAELSSLDVGDTRGPLQIGRYTWWLHVDAINESELHTVYDPEVQRSLYLELLQLRQIEEQNRYIDSLFQQGVYDDLDMMRARLLRVALLRYGR